MELEHLRYEVENGIATVTFDRPPVNAQNRRTREELIWVFDTISGSDHIKAAILTGGGRTFSAGADIKERSQLVAEPGTYFAHNRVTRESFFAMADCAKPVIAAINGPAIGAGYAAAACCDILLAAQDAWIQMPELDRGLAGGAKFLTQHFSRSTSRMLFFTGRKMGAEELWRQGVVSEVVPGPDLLPLAREIATEIAEKSPIAMRKAKAAFNAVEEMPHRDGYRFEQTVTYELSHTADAAEARNAFLEKRAPRFEGR
ncbi:MAG TPA: enoyl-CoA hydratase/isomerase family protein [Nocardiopsis listeri]|uniref:enoyl-CoA hydratase/isomerase family protein n=1 Tax=Nocardiopsis listeri TaxID=53440 RepID=UPI001D574B21|nr:enoyl-CoA hydratase/isomerase family protein [Nocardiopsis listeri]HJE59295.1 enoyl-CoA hydratase/isomerase family protein [Nocardiopsis listeri]